jgi:hypothetical protein
MTSLCQTLWPADIFTTWGCQKSNFCRSWLPLRSLSEGSLIIVNKVKSRKQIGKNFCSFLFMLNFRNQFPFRSFTGRFSFSYANHLAFLFFVDKSIGSGCFFPDLDPSVNWFGHAAITEMIKLQFTTITDRIRNKIRNGNWFLKFSINRKEQKFLPICLRLLTLLTIIKDPSLRGLRGNQVIS